MNQRICVGVFTLMKAPNDEKWFLIDRQTSKVVTDEKGIAHEFPSEAAARSWAEEHSREARRR